MEKETLKIDKAFIDKYQKLSLCLENCDVYEIETQDILDISFEANLRPQNRWYSCPYYKTESGFIKISSKTRGTQESSYLRNKHLGLSDYSLEERMKMCCDVTAFTLGDKKDKIGVFCPYDALEDIRGCEIEYSNCPSFETDKNGDMWIFFGEKSKMPKRKDNNYHELIEGWDCVCGEFRPELLKVRLEPRDYSKFWHKKKFSFVMDILKDGQPFQKAELAFTEARRYEMDIWITEDETVYDLRMSRMINGEIYVGFDNGGGGIDFYCKKIEIKK